MTDWTDEWPSEPGWYWFWGQPHYGLRSLDSELYSVRVYETSTGLAFVAEGDFMYRGGGGRGLWCPAVLPDLPEEAT